MVSALNRERNFFILFEDICGQINQNIFMKLVLDSSPSTASAFEEIFLYPDVLICCFFKLWNVRVKQLKMSGYVRDIRHIFCVLCIY